MKRYIRSYFIKMGCVCLCFMVFYFVEKASLYHMHLNPVSFLDFICKYIEIDKKYPYIDLSRLIFHLSPVFIFLFMFGMSLHEDWRTENIYRITRYHSRTNLYRSRIIILSIESLIVSILYIIILLLLYNSTGASIDTNTILSAAFILTIFSLLLISESMFLSLISMKIGTSYGFCISIFLLIVSLKFSIYIIDLHEKIAKFIGAFIFWINYTRCIKSSEVDMFDIFVSIVQTFFMIAIGYITTQTYDIIGSNTNQE